MTSPGRPAITTERISLRLTAAESDAVAKLMRDGPWQNKTEAIRAALRAAGGQTPSADPYLADACLEAAEQLRRIGVNLNQATRALNVLNVEQDTVIYAARQIPDVIEDVNGVLNELRSLAEQIKGG